jgi:predicted nucleic acid-binding protein
LPPNEKNVAESGPTYFLDTSALAKLYHHEAGSELVEAWAADDTMLLWISDLARAELHSALIRKVREGELTEEVLHGVLECFRVDLLHRFYLMPLTAMVVEGARGPSIYSSSNVPHFIELTTMDWLMIERLASPKRRNASNA